MKTTEIKPSKLYYTLGAVLFIAIAMITSYFCFLAKDSPDTTDIFTGCLCNVILLFAAGVMLNIIRVNATEILITPEKIGFTQQKDWTEIPFSEINSFSFRRVHDGSKYVKQLILTLSDGEEKAITLTGMATNQAELRQLLSEVKSW